MGRAPCCAKEGVNRGAWTAVEDKLLVEYINQHGEGKWRSIPKLAGLKRCGKSCRLRWLNYLRPDIKRGNIEPEEEDLIIRLHRLLGNRWSLIAGRLPGRTDNEIKNYWNTTLSKKRQQSGVSSTSAGINIQPINSSNLDHQEENKEKKIKKKMKMKTTKPPAIPLPVNSLTRSKAVRTKAMRCTKVIIPINDNNPVSDDVDNKWMIGADPRQDDSSHNKYWSSINEGGDNQFHHEYYGSLSGATTSGSGELEHDGRTNSGGEDEEDQLLDELLDFENFPSDFHKVVVGDQIGIASGSTTTAADTDFWSMLNDWVDMEDDDDDDDNIINNKKQGEGYQLLQ